MSWLSSFSFSLSILLEATRSNDVYVTYHKTTYFQNRIRIIVSSFSAMHLNYFILQNYGKKKQKSPRRGIEPWSPSWQAGILTTILSRMICTGDETNSKLGEHWETYIYVYLYLMQCYTKVSLTKKQLPNFLCTYKNSITSVFR